MGRTFQSQQNDKLDENRCKILEVHRSRSIDQVFVDHLGMICLCDTYCSLRIVNTYVKDAMNDIN